MNKSYIPTKYIALAFAYDYCYNECLCFSLEIATATQSLGAMQYINLINKFPMHKNGKANCGSMPCCLK